MSPLYVGAANSSNKFLGNLSSDPGSGNAEGDLYYNTSTDKYRYYDGSSWKNMGHDLGTQQNPASSAKAIYDTGNRTNGAYYLDHGSGSYQTYCWIDSNSGGGYHLVAKIDDGSNSNWYYAGNRWTTSTEINPGNLVNLNDTEGVNRGYYQYVIQTGFRMGLHVPTPTAVSNYLTEGKSGKTAKQYFTDSANTHGSSRSRNDFLNWVAGAGTGFDNGFVSNMNTHQANCNHRGFNATTATSFARWGISGNNENDCNSNDSTIGFGAYHSTGSPTHNASGGRSTHALNTSRQAIGYIFVQ